MSTADVMYLVTGEYPPQRGGVADYSRLVAEGLAAHGANVHVIAPGNEPTRREGTIEVHRVAGRFAKAGLRRASAVLDRGAAPRHIVVQWVPHAYGTRAMNLPFCWWVHQRASHHGDHVELMIHEAGLAFEGSWKQRVAAVIHRVMLVLLLRVARRVHVSTPAWVDLCRPFALGRNLEFVWTPVPSNIPFVAREADVRALRARLAPRGERIVAHFGTYGPLVTRFLLPALERLLETDVRLRVVLLGPGGAAVRDQLARGDAARAQRIYAPGAIEAAELSTWLRAADLFVQPYADGVSARRGSAMAVLEHGRPMVSTDGRATEATWRTSGAVALVPAGDPQALAQESARLLDEHDERERLGAAAAALYAERFALVHTVRALRDGRAAAA